MDSMVERRFCRFVIQPGRRQLLIDGKPAKIGSRAFDVLTALVERRQRVVTKEELLDLVWPGIAVEQSNLQVHIMALRKLLGSDAIATIPGRGYQFVGAIDEQDAPAISASTDLPTTTIDMEPLVGSRTETRRLGVFRHASFVKAAGLIALIVACGAFYIAWRKPPSYDVFKRFTQAEAAHLSLVVLPFINLSNDPSQDYFADGLTENLTTDLSRIRNSFVIARDTAFTFKGKSIDAKAIGKELGVRYLLEGSVQRDRNRVRVDAQLIDSESGAHLWAERFEEDVADLFKLQDQVVTRLANTLGIELVKAEARKGSRAGNPDVMDLTMRGWALLRTLPQTKDKNVPARALFEQALAIDPNNADALAGDAYSYLIERGYQINPDTDYDAKILGEADRAIALAPDSLWAYYAKSVYLSYSRRAAEALDAADAGLAINPNFGPLQNVRNLAEMFLGRFEQAKSDMLQTMRSSPREPLIGITHNYLGHAELGLGHFDAAIDEYHKSIELGFVSCFPYAGLAAAYALEGKMEEAKSALEAARRLDPNLTVKRTISASLNIQLLFEGLRKAGLPEA
jgi:TolB-like protein/DNA-binding winged helix-turn-helix (wHTH) protein/Flp pilus assembly protein TadD